MLEDKLREVGIIEIDEYNYEYDKEWIVWRYDFYKDNFDTFEAALDYVIKEKR